MLLSQSIAEDTLTMGDSEITMEDSEITMEDSEITMEDSEIIEEAIIGVFKNEVVVMEDSEITEEAIINFMKKELNWEVITCYDQEEAVGFAQNKRAAFFILDSSIKNNNQEGLDALERIKEINEKNFVAILSAHPENIERANNLQSNLSEEKTHDITKNLQNIAHKMLEYRKKMVENILEKTNKELEYIDKLERTYKSQSDPQNTDEHKQSANISAYEKSKSNPDWFSEHEGDYVAFVDGEFKFSCKDRGEFFKQLVNSDEYKEKQIFFVKVVEKERVIEEPTSLWFDIV